MPSIGVPELIILFGIFVTALVTACLPFYLIFRKAGYSGFLSALMLLPVVNLIVLFWFAFSAWPALRSKNS